MSEEKFSPFIQLSTRKGPVYLRREAIVRVDRVGKEGQRRVYAVGVEPVDVEDTPENLSKIGIR